MPGTSASCPVSEQDADIRRHLAHDPGDLAIGIDPELVLAEDLHHVGHLVEDRTECRIAHAGDYTRSTTALSPVHSDEF